MDDRSLLDAGILRPRTPERALCIHCSLPVDAGCRCGSPLDDRRRRHGAAQENGPAPASRLPGWSILGSRRASA